MHTNFSYKQTDRKKTTCLPQRGGGIQTLVTNRQTGQKQHAFLKGEGGGEERHTNFSYKQNKNNMPSSKWGRHDNN